MQELQSEAQYEISGTYQAAPLNQNQDNNAEAYSVKPISNKSQDQAQGQMEKVLKDSNDKVEPLLDSSQKSKTRSRGLLKALLSRFRAQNPAVALDLRESDSFGGQELAQQADLQNKEKSRDNTKTTNDEVKTKELKMKNSSEVPQARNSKLNRNSAIPHRKSRRLPNENDSEGGTSSVELDSTTNLNEDREKGVSDLQPNRVKFASSQNMEDNESNDTISAEDRFLVSEPEDSRQNQFSGTANTAKPPFLPRPKSEKHSKNAIRNKITVHGTKELLESQSVPIQARMARPRSFSRLGDRKNVGRLSLKDNRQADEGSHGSIDENMRTSFKTPDVPETVFTNPKDSSSGEEAVSRVPDYLRQESDFTQAESLVFGLSEQYSSEGERELHQAMKEKLHWSPKKGSSLPLEKSSKVEKSPRHIGSPWHPDSSSVVNNEQDGKNAKVGMENSFDQERNTDKVNFDLD